MKEVFRCLVGVDQGGEHEVVVLDADGSRLGQRRARHSGAGLRELIEWVRDLCGDSLAGVAVATETPRGAVVQDFLGAGATVFAMNPKQLDRFRDRHSASGAKDDGRDAFVLADALRNDRHAFQRVEAETDMVAELRELGRLRDRLVEQLGRLSNQLRARLAEVWPELLDLSPGADEPWIWALLAKAPTPHRARKLVPRSLASLLRQHRIRRLTGRQLYRVLQEPILPLGEGVWSAAQHEIGLLSDQCALTHRHLKQTEACIKQVLEQAVEQEEEGEEGGGSPSDAKILLSFAGAGLVVASRFLGEAPHLLRDYRRLRMVSGAAPVTKTSCKSRVVIRRKSCNQRLNEALYHWARNALLKDPGLRERYDKLRRRGHSHGRALRQIGDYLLRCLSAALRNRTLYQPRAQHQDQLDAA